ncbi:MAG: hypothetical protein F6K47_03120 [Symploca sp. SIO2E6]|nr:hypothetical protein [Symploca sp. SIO2E6]
MSETVLATASAVESLVAVAQPVKVTRTQEKSNNLCKWVFIIFRELGIGNWELGIGNWE